MFYPLKFKPFYKDYIWGGRNLEKLGKELPMGIVAESWEVSCHPDGPSTVANGDFKGMKLSRLVAKYGRRIVGNALPDKDIEKFPLLVKFIDANKNLSVQVHPDDNYATANEKGEYGKNEMWYVISAKASSKLVYDVEEGVTRESFAKAVEEGSIKKCLKEIPVSAGDVINIPSGLVHAIGKGIVLAEIQQNSNSTYRVYDYNRVDAKGSKRPLHIDKALDVIDFDTKNRREKCRGLKVPLKSGCYKTYMIANKYFSIEIYEIDGTIIENTRGERFYIYVVVEGSGKIEYAGKTMDIKLGESILIPAEMEGYEMSGCFKALKAYVPDIDNNIITPLLKAGFSVEEIISKIEGL